MTFRWEVRREVRYGSRHEGWFSSERAALEHVEKSGVPHRRVGDVFYLSPHADEA
ncbi:hypothetical protein ACVIGB_000543 [Bradyrhizobium sp. USDA 4341]